MHALLNTAYADTSPAQLILSLTESPRDALQSVECELNGHRLSLRLLGASHQILVDGSAPWTETLACLPGDPYLPESLQRRGEHGNYRFTSTVTAVDTDGLRREVEALQANLADRPDAVIGHYPGLPLAVTAIAAAADPVGLRWDTWHTYPQCGSLVRTTSTLAVRR